MKKEKKKFFTNVFGRFTKRRRDELNLSQKELGARLSPKVTTQFISNIERGITPLPLTHVRAFSKALKISEKEIAEKMIEAFCEKLSKKLDLGLKKPTSPLIEKRVLSVWKKWNQIYKRLPLEEKDQFLKKCETLLASYAPYEDHFL